MDGLTPTLLAELLLDLHDEQENRRTELAALTETARQTKALAALVLFVADRLGAFSSPNAGAVQSLSQMREALSTAIFGDDTAGEKPRGARSAEQFLKDRQAGRRRGTHVRSVADLPSS